MHNSQQKLSLRHKKEALSGLKGLIKTVGLKVTT